MVRVRPWSALCAVLVAIASKDCAPSAAIASERSTSWFTGSHKLSVDRQLKIAQTFEKQGRTADAKRVYEQILGEHPESQEASRRLALINGVDSGKQQQTLPTPTIPQTLPPGQLASSNPAAVPIPQPVAVPSNPAAIQPPNMLDPRSTQAIPMNLAAPPPQAFVVQTQPPVPPPTVPVNPNPPVTVGSVQSQPPRRALTVPPVSLLADLPANPPPAPLNQPQAVSPIPVAQSEPTRTAQTAGSVTIVDIPRHPPEVPVAEEFLLPVVRSSSEAAAEPRHQVLSSPRVITEITTEPAAEIVIARSQPVPRGATSPPVSVIIASTVTSPPVLLSDAPAKISIPEDQSDLECSFTTVVSEGAVEPNRHTADSPNEFLMPIVQSSRPTASPASRPVAEAPFSEMADWEPEPQKLQAPVITPAAPVEVVGKKEQQRCAALQPFFNVSHRQLITMLREQRAHLESILLQVATDDSFHLRDRSLAVFLLGELGTGATPALPKLRQTMRATRNSTLRIELAQTVLLIHPEDVEAINVLLKLLRGPDDNDKWYAACVLRASASPRTTFVVNALVAALDSDNPRLRRMVFLTLGEFGPAAVQAVPKLQAALNDQDPRTREVAETVLAAIVPQRDDGSLPREVSPSK